MTFGIAVALFGLAFLLLGLATKAALDVQRFDARDLAIVAATWLFAAAILFAMARADRILG